VVSPFAPFTAGPVGSAYHGGIASPTSFSRIDSAHGTASAYVISDIGVAPPAT
jgi:hypothetical protein